MGVSTGNSREGSHVRAARYSPLMEETMLIASGAKTTENLYVSASYFRSLPTTGARDLVSYSRLPGSSSLQLKNMAEFWSKGIRFLADAARTQSTKAESIIKTSS